MKARAAVLEGPERVAIWEVERPPQPPDGVGGWLHVEACGVSRADVANYLGNGGLREFGVALGRETVGVVDELDPSLAVRWGIEPGCRVLMEEYIPCFRCELCLRGAYRRCQRRRQYGAVPVEVPPVLWGGFADQLYLDPHAVAHPVPDGLAPILATFAIPLADGISWLHTAGAYQVGESVLVQGTGPRGLATLLAARLAGASPLIVVAPPAEAGRLELARQLGADLTVAGNADTVVDIVMGATANRGADVVVDTTLDDPGAIHTAVRCAALLGRIVIAVIKRCEPPSDVGTDAVVRRELTLRGVAGREPWAIRRALDWLKDHAGELPDGMLTEYTVDRSEAAIRALGRLDGVGAPAHVVVRP